MGTNAHLEAIMCEYKIKETELLKWFHKVFKKNNIPCFLEVGKDGKEILRFFNKNTGIVERRLDHNSLNMVIHNMYRRDDLANVLDMTDEMNFLNTQRTILNLIIKLGFNNIGHKYFFKNKNTFECFTLFSINSEDIFRKSFDRLLSDKMLKRKFFFWYEITIYGIEAYYDFVIRNSSPSYFDLINKDSKKQNISTFYINNYNQVVNEKNTILQLFDSYRNKKVTTFIQLTMLIATAISAMGTVFSAFFK